MNLFPGGMVQKNTLLGSCPAAARRLLGGCPFGLREFVLNYRHPAPRREEPGAGSAGQVAFPVDPLDPVNPLDPLDPVLSSQIEALIA